MSADRYTTYKLQFPVEYGDDLITELKIRRPQGKHLRGLKLNALDEVDVALDLFGSLSGQPPRVIDLIEAEDITAVMEVLGNFLSKTSPALKT
jgi:hypothetical protein